MATLPAAPESGTLLNLPDEPIRHILASGYGAEISPDHSHLNVFTAEGAPAFSLAAPEFSVFYTFAEHINYGTCPVVSFNSAHSHQGWPDWYCRVDVKAQSIHLINPWR